jgi:hypothetical protein
VGPHGFQKEFLVREREGSQREPDDHKDESDASATAVQELIEGNGGGGARVGLDVGGIEDHAARKGRDGGMWAEVCERSSCDAIERFIRIILYKLSA